MAETGPTGDGQDTSEPPGRGARRRAEKRAKRRGKDSLEMPVFLKAVLSLLVLLMVVLLVFVIVVEITSRRPLDEWPAGLPRCDDPEVVDAVVGEPVIVERWALINAHVYEIRALKVLESAPRHVEHTGGQTRLVCGAKFFVDSAEETDEHLPNGVIEIQTLPGGGVSLVWEVDGARSTARPLER